MRSTADPEGAAPVEPPGATETGAATTTTTAASQGWQAARRVLHGPLRRLVSGQGLGQAADGFAQVAFAQVVLFEIGEGATPAEIAGLLAVTLLPFSLVGPFAGVVIDRWDRRRVLTLVSLLRAALLVVSSSILVTRWEWAGYVGVLLLLSASRFVLAAKGAALPTTVAPGELVAANAVSSLVGMIAAFGGAVVGAAVVSTVPAFGFVAAATLYALAAMVFRSLPPVGGGAASETMGHGVTRIAGELADGLRTIATTRAIGVPLAAVWAHRFLLGAGFIVLVLIADTFYGYEVSGYALALAVTGAAAFAGTWVTPPIASRVPASALFGPSFVLAAMAALVGGASLALGTLIAGVAVTAFAFQVLKVTVDALVGGATPDELRGRVFSVYDVLYNVAFVLAGLVLVPLWEPSRARVLLWWLAGLYALAGVVAARLVHGWPFDRDDRARQRHEGSPRRRWVSRGGAFAAGSLVVLAFPEPAWWWLAWVALVPWLVIVSRSPTRREAGLRGWFGAMGFLAVMHHWLLPTVGPFIIPLAMAAAVPWLLWGRLVAATVAPPWSPTRSAGAVILVPAGWVVIEGVRSWEYLGGPWALLGASQWNAPPLLASATLGGVWLTSLLIVATNTALVVAAGAATDHRPQGTPRATIAAALTLALAAVLLGPAWAAMGPPTQRAGALRIGVVQHGVGFGPDERIAQGEALTRTLVGQDADLVVWGESSVAFDLRARPDLVERFTALSRAVDAELLVSTDARAGSVESVRESSTGSGGIYKSAVLIGPDGIEGSYDKMRLVPFGEYVPLRFAFGWTSVVTKAADENRRRGTGLVVLGVTARRDDTVLVAPLVCFESAFPDLSRSAANLDADVVVVQSANTTFQQSWTPEQHASLAAVRAVEIGRPVVHVTLSGVSSVFTPDGEQLLWLGSDERGAQVVELPLDRRTTPYLVLGDWVLIGSWVALGTGAIAAGLRRGRAGIGAGS